MMNIRTLMCLAMAVVPGICVGQSRHLVDEAAVRKAADALMSSVAADNLTDLWAQMRPYTAVPEVELNAIEAQFRSQQPLVLQRIGPPEDYELIREERAGTSLIRFQYIARHERAPNRWVFQFYRTPKGWALTDFRSDGNIHALYPSGS